MTDTSEVTQVITAPRRQHADVSEQPAGPGRLRLRHRLLLWSTPALILLLVFAVKLASVGILGNRLPQQFADHDQAGMTSTLGWIDVGDLGRGYRETLAAGDVAALDGDLQAAYAEFAAAHEKEPSACPPRANFALTSENLSDNELRRGNFARADQLLEPAALAANEDGDCFTTSTSSDPDVRTIVGQTPDRLSAKAAALKAGAITATANGYDYLRAPGGSIQAVGPLKPCPFDDGDERVLRDCIRKTDEERLRKVQEAQQQEQQRKAAEDQAKQPPPAPGQPPPQPPPPPPPPPPGAQAPPTPPSDDTPEFPGAPAPPKPSKPDPSGDGPPIGFCVSNGKPLDALAAALCATSGPLP